VIDLQVGDIIFVKGDDLISRVIEFAENGPYSHVAIYAGNGQVIEAQGGRTIGFNNLSVYKNYDVGRVDMTDFQREALIRYAKTQFGKRYDWELVYVLFLKLVLHINKPYQEKTRRICSTFVRDCFDHVGITLTKIENCTPEDLAESLAVRILGGVSA
jgi:cell wall-associated NlpC family hydrolase